MASKGSPVVFYLTKHVFTINQPSLLVPDADVRAVPEGLLRAAADSLLVRRHAVLRPVVRILTAWCERGETRGQSLKNCHF